MAMGSGTSFSLMKLKVEKMVCCTDSYVLCLHL